MVLSLYRHIVKNKKERHTVQTIVAKIVMRELRGALSHLKTTVGRRRRFIDASEGDCSDPFIQDEISILCSKAYRRLSGKTQVTSFPQNPHIRNRQSHTAEVVACAVSISEILGLNTNLVRAIAQGHDIGHIPFGHQGEAWLAEHTGISFTHEVMGVVVAQHIERQGKGLELTHEVLEGMMCHSGKNVSETMTPEAWVVRYADKFAYIFADYNDFRRIGFPVWPDLESRMALFGQTQRERVERVILGLCIESAKEGKVSFSESDLALEFEVLRRQMYDIYPRITEQNPQHIMERVYDFVEKLKIADPWIILALMTDADMVRLSEQKLINFSHIRQTAAGEIIDSLTAREIDCCAPDLSW